MDTQTPAGGDTGTPGPVPGPGPGPHPGTTPPPAPHGFWAGVRRTGLYRSDERWIGGVAGGLAQRIGVDPLVVRGLLAVTFLIGGLGLVLYGVAWALLPDARDNRILLERLTAGDANGALIGSLAFVVVGLARGDGWWWFWDGGTALGGVLWLAAVVGIVALVVTAVQRRQRGPAPWPPAGGGPGAAPWSGSAPAGTWQQTTTAPVPGAGATPPPPPPPPYPPYASPYGSAPVPPLVVPVRPARRGADAATTGAVIGLSVVGLGVLMLAARAGAFDGPVWLAAGGISLVVAGLGVATLALRGRGSGVVGFLAVVATLVWVPAALVHQADWPDGPRGWKETAQDVDVTSRTVAAEGFELGVGSSRVDLTSVPLTDDELRVPISLGAGDLTVVVPQEAAVRAHVTAGAGSVRWEIDGEVQEHGGVGLGDLTYEDEDAADDGPDLVLDISAGAGEIRIIEEATA